MRILVVSDVHGDYFNLQKVLLSQSGAEVVIFCGDGEREIQQAKLNFPEKMFICVKGNCDFNSLLKPIEIVTIANKKIFVTHGHLYNAKLTYYNLYCAAREQEADILLFGHTHQAFRDCGDNLYVLNPGSCRGYNASYGYIDITDSGAVITNIVKI